MLSYRTAITALCLAVLAQAQLPQRCEWHYPQNSDTVTHEWKDKYGKSTYITNVFNYADPVSIDSLNGLTFNVPENVTRIKRTALAFKVPADALGGGADIMFLRDNSGSMHYGSEKQAVITYEGDTLYRVVGGDISGFPVGTVVKMVQGEPREFDLYCCSDRNDLHRTPGDPFYESWGMMKEAIIFQRNIVENAYAGFMSFAGRHKRDNDPGSGFHEYYKPLANVSRGHPDAINNLMELWYLGRNEYDGRTLPGPPLPLSKTRKAMWTAIQWGLDDAMEDLQNLGKTNQRAVIAFSDGEVHDLKPDLMSDEKIASYPYPVYSISLVPTKTDTNFTMARLTEGTGGAHWTIKPGDQDSLANVVQRILGKITKAKIPVEVELINNSLTPPQTSYCANWGLEKTPDGSAWAIELDSVLALAEGTNNLTFNVIFEDGETGQRETKTASFTVNVGGGAHDENFVTCYNAATMAVRTETGRTTRIHPEDDHSFEVSLTNSAFDLVGRNNPAIAYSKILGDTVMMQLDDTIAKNFGNFPYETFSDGYSYQGMATARDTGDQTLQSAEEDTLVFRWEHPRDPRDTATLIMPTDDGSLIPPAADPAPKADPWKQASLAVTLIDQNPGLDPSIRYSINGGAFQTYAAPIQLTGQTQSQTFTIRAFATLQDWKNSDTVSFVYVIEIPKLEPPRATPPHGSGESYEKATLEVTLWDPNTGASASIYYSVDNAPFQQYVLPLQLEANASGISHTVRAYAAAEGYLNSDTVSFVYTQTLPTLNPPTASPAPKTDPWEQASLTVTLKQDNPGASAVIWYSINDGAFDQYSSPLQLSAGSQGDSHTIKAFVTASGYINSDTIPFTYTMTLPRLDAPTANPDGGPFMGAVLVTLSHAEQGATIRYTLDGSDPLSSSTALNYAEAFTIRNPGTTVLKAIATKDGFLPSDLLEVSFVNEDSEGPFVTAASYYLGNLPGAGTTNKPDTLVISFNEPVRCDELNAGNLHALFQYVDSDGAFTSADIFAGATMRESCTGARQSVAFILPAAGKISPVDDLIGAAADALFDKYANASGAENPVVIAWGRNYEVFSIARTIFTADDPIPGAVLASLKPGALQPPSKGCAIQIMSAKPAIADKSHVRVYDAVGNLVGRDLPVYSVKGDQSRYWAFWNGENLTGRKVGAGNYMAVLSLRLNDGSVNQKQIKLGVQNRPAQEAQN